MATSARSTAIGAFADWQQAQRAVDELERAGFGHEQIGFLRPEGERGAGHTRVRNADNEFEGNTGVGDSDTEIERDTTRGAVTGGLIGTLLGAAAALLLPGIGPVVAGGILGTALAGAGVGVAAGGIAGALQGLGVSDEEARHHENEFRAGRVLVTVKADGRYDEAQAILRRRAA